MLAETDFREELSDSELERHIRDLGGLMLMAYASFERTADPVDRQAAARWALFQRQAIARRSPEQVARMEAERGLD